MIDGLLKHLGCPPLPTEDEVQAALSIEEWRSKQYILKLINETRLSMGSAPLEEGSLMELLGLVGHRILSILRELQEDGQVESTDGSNLLVEEMAVSDDRNILSPVNIHRLRENRGGRRPVLYRKGAGGIHRRIEEQEGTQVLGVVIPN